MYVALRFVGLLFAIGTIILLFASFFVPEPALSEKGMGAKGRALVLAALFGSAAVVCYVISFFVGA